MDDNVEEIWRRMRASQAHIVIRELTNLWFESGTKFDDLTRENGYDIEIKPVSDDFATLSFTKQ